jgi:hypothetical protein
MDFRAYADKEAAEFVSRLTKASSEAAVEAEKRVAEQAKRAAEEAKRAADEAQKAAEASRADALKVAEALKAELQATVKQKMAVAASLKEAQAQTESVRTDLKTATDRGEGVSRQLADARKSNERLEKTVGELSAARDELAKARTAAETELQKARAALQSARADVEAAAKSVEKISAEKLAAEDAASTALHASEASEAKLVAVTDLFKQSGGRVKVLERAQQDGERKIAALEARLREAAPAAAVVAAPAAAVVASPLPIFDDLLAGFQALGSATTIADVLTTLIEQLAAQFPRVALFRVKKSHLQGEHQIGFDLKTDIAKVVMPLGMDSLLSRAASSGSIERLSAEELKNTSAPFSGSPQNALALPIAVGGDTLAIVYVDDSGMPAGAAGEIEVNVRFAEAMQQHAIALLSRLTSELKTLAELKTYAASLLRELEQMYAADAQTGIDGSNMQARLKGNLEYARSIYSSRIALEGADAAALLDDELGALISAQQDTPFGRDLAAATGVPAAARKTAEAS